MRLTIALLLFFTFQVNANGYAQKITIVKKNARLTELFKSIEGQTGFLFFYDKVLLQSSAPIDVDIREVTLEQALSACLKNQQLTYSIVKNTIVIRREKKLPKQLENITALPEANPPPVEVHGQIKDEDGNPLSNASVSIKGSNKGVTTNASGDFTIEVPDNRTILVISFTSYASQEIQIGNRTTFKITLVKTNSSLDAVVVTALGIKRREKSLTYSEQTVKTNQLNEAKETNVINTLQGKIAGINITKNATGPGSSSKVLLRGTRSIFGNSQPLYVVDGVPLDNTSREQGDGGTHGGRDGGDAIGMLNSDDIESLTVLKGASAAALYGSQGQNGAIIISTKRGKVGKISVNYTGNITMDQANILPEMQSDYGQGAGGVYNSKSETSWGPKIAGQPITLWNGHKVNMTGQPDRVKDFFRKALTTSNTVSVTGGSEKMQTYFSYGNTSAEGILRNHDLNRNNFDLKIENNVTAKLSFFAKMTYIVEDVNNKPYTGERNDATGSIYHAPASIPLSEMQNFEYFDSLGFRKQSYWSPNSTYFSNPYWKMYRQSFHEQKHRLLGLFSAQYKFNSWIDVQVRGSVDRNDEKTDEKMFQDSYELSGNGNLYNLYNGTRQARNMDALLSIKHDLGKSFNLTAHIGGSVQQTTYETVYTMANGLNKLDFFTMDNARNPKTTNNLGSTPQVQSLYATATLSFKDYLYLDVTGRNDWSSALPKENQSYFYPSFGLSAILSEVLKLPSWISFGKARVSVANAGYGGQEYLTNSYFNVAAGGTINPPTTRSLGNYKPEITSSFEAGLNWQFFDNRLGFDATYYKSQTKNQLISLSVPNATLFNAQYINAGLIENKGVEVILNGTPVRTKSFSWEIAVNFAKNINKLVRLTNVLTSAILGDDKEVLERADVGHSFGEMYMAEWKKDSLGRKVVDANGIPVVTGKTAYAGNYNPDYTLGVLNTLNFSRLSLRFLIDYRHGGTVVAGTQAGLDAAGDSKQSLIGREGMVLDAFTADGKVNTKSITAETYWQSLGNRTPVKDMYAYSATNMRLRELALGYRISDRLVSKTNVITAAKLSLVGRNLFFFQRDAPYDPEIATAISNRGGLEYNSLPSTRSIGLNLTLTF